MTTWKCPLDGCTFPGPHMHGTEASDKPADRSTPACAHRTASLIYAEPNGRWKCDGCDLILAPAFDMMRVETFETALDAIAGTMSAVLFDYTERMAERYGIRADDVRTGDTNTHDCETDGHMRNNSGICVHCADNPFLGGEPDATQP